MLWCYTLGMVSIFHDGRKIEGYLGEEMERGHREVETSKAFLSSDRQIEKSQVEITTWQGVKFKCHIDEEKEYQRGLRKKRWDMVYSPPLRASRRGCVLTGGTEQLMLNSGGKNIAGRPPAGSLRPWEHATGPRQCEDDPSCLSSVSLLQGHFSMKGKSARETWKCSSSSIAQGYVICKTNLKHIGVKEYKLNFSFTANPSPFNRIIKVWRLSSLWTHDAFASYISILQWCIMTQKHCWPSFHSRFNIKV